ncbi:MAG: hypothetical protein ACOVQE_05570 [Chitinophagaceae bacterium]
MKKMITIVLLLASTTVWAQGKFEAGMSKALELMQKSKTPAEMLETASFFERIADAEKDKWLPYYYAAFNKYLVGMNDKNADKDKIAAQCLELIEKAEALEKNADLYCLRQQVAVLQMMVDPMNRWQTYNGIANEALNNAKKLNADNPRIYYLEGMTLFNTPSAYGGGKEPAKQLFQKSVDLFQKYQPATPFHPNWGKEMASKMLAACQ